MHNQAGWEGGFPGFKLLQPTAAMDGYMAAWKAVAGEWNGAGKTIAQVSIEATTLMSRRAKAAMDLPARMGACRQPQDIIELQLSYWQTCMKQYADCVRHVGQHVSEFQALTGVDESLSDPGEARPRATAAGSRDYITFPETNAEAMPQSATAMDENADTEQQADAAKNTAGQRSAAA